MSFSQRRYLLHMALMMRSDEQFLGAMEQADPVNQNALVILREWALAGCQSVIMPDTYAAALMATDAAAAITPQTRLPWPAFEIILPQGLLVSPTGRLQTALICQRPPNVRPKGGGVFHEYFCMYVDERTTACHTFVTLRDVVEPENTMGNLGYHGASGTYDQDAEHRIWQCLGRLFGGVLLAIENARAEDPAAYAPKPLNVKPKKRGEFEVQANVFKLGKPLKLDLRPQIKEFVSGRAGGGGVPSVRTMVRGHWKRQFHGPGRSLRKNIAIAPYFRGEGPALIRATKLSPGDDDGSLEGFSDFSWEG